MTFGFLAQPVEHDAGLDTRCLALRIESDQFVQIFREIEHHRDIAALSRETGTASARKQRSAIAAALFDRRKNVLDRLGHDDANRHLPIVGAVGRVERAAAGIETDLALDSLFELGLKFLRLTGWVVSRRVGVPRRSAIHAATLP